jgi:HPt (histidine-containing phosphotransfer) domain-containing protein
MRAPQKPEAFDLAWTVTRVGGNETLLRKMARIFLEQSPQWLTEIRMAIANADPTALQESAHALKGSGTNFRARSVVEAALRLETMGRVNDLTEAEAAFATLVDAYQELCEALVPLAREIE